MGVDPADYISEPNNWFFTNIVYECIGRAEFKSPSGYIEGQTRVEFDEEGNAEIVLQIEKHECYECIDADNVLEDTLSWLLTGIKPLKIGGFTTQEVPINPENKCDSLVITTDQGIFSAHDNILYYSYSLERKFVRFYTLSSVFKTNSVQKAKYFVMPLTNFVSKSLYVPRQRSILDKHPLRTFPTPEVSTELSPEDQKEAIWYATRRNCFIHFNFAKTLGFIERLPDYDDRADQLKNGKSNLRITSVLVGECEDKLLSMRDALDWMPLELLHLLSLATGSLVGSPWFEFRAENGELVGRLHRQQWQSRYSAGHEAIDIFSAGGISSLLSDAPLDITPQLRIAIRLLVKSSQPDSLENQLALMFRACDTLTPDLRHKLILDQQDLDQATQDMINPILKETGKKIKRIGMELPETEARALDRIAQIVSHEVTKPKSPDQAQAIVLMAEMHGLKDFSVLDKYEWGQTYKKYRNRIIHEGYIPTSDPDKYPESEYFALHTHLLDLLIRIILKSLNYDGEYKKYTRYRKNRFVDWVSTETPMRDLWQDYFANEEV